MELCWALSPSHWGKGSAAEAAIVAIEWASDSNIADSLISLIDPRNIKSINVASRIGETFKEHIEFMGQTTKLYEIKINHLYCKQIYADQLYTKL